MSIREAALGSQSLRVQVLAAMKAAEAASAAVEALSLSLAELANGIYASQAVEQVGCAHANTADITTMCSDPQIMCMDCGEIVVSEDSDGRETSA